MVSTEHLTFYMLTLCRKETESSSDLLIFLVNNIESQLISMNIKNKNNQILFYLILATMSFVCFL